MSTFQRRFVRRLGVAALTLATVGASLLGQAFAPAATRAADASTLLVYTDATRLPGFQLYQKTHPNVHLKIVTFGADLPSKILLFNRAGSGWPDVVFDAGPADVARLSTPQYHYTAALDGLVPAATIAKFAASPTNQCRFNGKLYCLRNDIAQEVLWYNATLMKRFGYTAPTTWEQYQALGLRVAKEHPGYVVGSFGDPQALNMYFWPSGCPVETLTGANNARINMSDPKCTRVAAMADALLTAGSMSRFGPFETGFITLGTQDKILMLPAASWYGDYVFKPSYKTPKGEISVALTPRWSSERSNWGGAQGGGAYFVSSHSQNPRAAADVVTWMTTNNAYQATAPTFPAYLPAADAWAQGHSRDPFYATNIYPLLRQAASLIQPDWAFTRYDTDAANTFGTVVVTAVKARKTVASALPTFQTRLSQLAQIAGYNVSQ